MPSRMIDPDRFDNDPLAQSIDQASRVDNPDGYAESLKLAEQQEIPRLTVENNISEVRRRDRAQRMNPEEMRVYSPRLADFMSDPDNAALSVDDLQNLQNLELALTQPNFFVRRAEDLQRGVLKFVQGTELTKGVSQYEYLQQLQNINDSETFDREAYIESRKGTGNPELISADAWDMEEFSKLPPEERQSKIDSVKQKLERSLRGVAAAQQGIEERPVSAARNKFDQAESFGEAFEQFVNNPLEVTTSLSSESFGQFLPALPFMAVPGGMAIGGGMTSYMNEYAGDIQGSLMEVGADMSDINSVVEALSDTERLEEWKVHANKRGVPIAIIDALSAGVAGRLTAAASTPLGRATTGAAESIVLHPGLGGLGEVAGAVSAGDEIEGAAVLAEILGEGPTGVTETAVGYYNARQETISNRVGRDMERLMESAGDQVRIDQAIEVAENSTLNQRAQDRFRDFLDGIPENKTVYVDSSVISEMIEEGLELPNYIIEAVNDSDVEIPMSKFLPDIATQPELLARIRPHIKMNPDNQTQEQMTSGENQTLQNMVERAEKSAELKTEADRIYDEVKDQLVATGRQGEATARFSATIIPAYVTTKAEELGISPQEIYKEMGLKIESGTTESGDALQQSHLNIKEVDTNTLTEAQEKSTAAQASASSQFSLAGRGLQGAVETASTKQPIDMSVNFLNTLEGVQGEQRFRDTNQDKLQPLLDTMSKAGYDQSNPIVIMVNGEGQAFIEEGNHRVAAATQSGIDNIPARVKYFNGGEKINNLEQTTPDKKDFGDSEIIVRNAEGESTHYAPAQREYDRLTKRRNTVIALRQCVGGGV